MMPWRYPDKPIKATPQAILNLDGYHVVQPKYDGWRCLVCRQPNRMLSAWTRHRQPLHVALNRSDDFTTEMYDWLWDAQIPMGTVLDCEFLTSRRIEGQQEKLIAFDLLYLDGVWMGSEPWGVRWHELRLLMARMPRRKTEPPVALCETKRIGEFLPVESGWLERPEVEGVVFKSDSSTLVGGRSRCEKNPHWFKVLKK